MEHIQALSLRAKAFINIQNAATQLIVALESTVTNSQPDSKAYKNAVACLADHELLVRQVYSMATNNVYSDNFCELAKTANSFIKDIKTCGKLWLMRLCDSRVTNLGY